MCAENNLDVYVLHCSLKIEGTFRRNHGRTGRRRGQDQAHEDGVRKMFDLWRDVRKHIAGSCDHNELFRRCAALLA